MFSSLKSFSSNINASYSVSQTVSSTAGAWKIYDAKKKSTQKPYSVFVFDRKSLDSHGKRPPAIAPRARRRATADAVCVREKGAR